MKTHRVIIKGVGFVDLKVDDEDYEKVSHLNIVTGKFGYAWVSYGKDYSHSLAVELLNPPKGYVVDHIDRDIYNFQRSNLRVITQGQNTQNRALASNNTTGFKGVFRQGNRFFTYLVANGVRHPGERRFDNAEECARHYDELVKKYQPYGTTNETLNLYRPKSQ